MELFNFIVACVLLACVPTSLTQKITGNEIDLRPQCSEARDLIFANCFNLKEAGKCEGEAKKMQYYCPLTCRQCKGPLAENRVSRPPVAECVTSKFGCCKDKETIAQGPDFLGCPEKCYDTPNYQCAFYKKIGFCKMEMYRNTMLTRCPLSCDYCKPVVPGKRRGCFNKWNTEMCEKFKRYNLCSSLRFGDRLAKNCKMTCNKCKINRGPALLSVALECSHDDNCCWDRSKPKNGRCPACNDRYGAAFCQNFKIDCSDTTEIKGVQIRNLCQKTCGLCDVPKKCVDDIIYGEFCETWKDRGQCKKQPFIMKTYCRKTCGFC